MQKSAAEIKANYKAILRRGISHILDVIFPPQALWEPEQAGKLLFIDDPQCACCGFPFPYDQGKDALCGNCIAERPDYDRARSVLAYDEISRQAILSLKHAGQTNGLNVFARQMARAGRDLFEGAEGLIPVPLHASRLRKRRFNQAALLATSLSIQTGIPVYSHVLLRVKPTDSQAGKSVLARQRNVRGVFKINEKHRDDIKGKHMIVIDDVMTTGATLEACAKTLKQAGAKHVDVLTIARVLKDNAI